MKRYEYVVLGLLFVFGFVLRIYNLGFQSLWIDESFTINASLAVLKHFYPLLDSGILYSGYLFHTYLVALMFSFGVSEFTARFPSVVFGSLLIPLVYLFVRYLFNNRVALISSVFVCFSTLEIAWSRQARSYIVLQFVFFLSLFLFLYFVRTKELKYLYYSFIVALLGYFVHPLSLFLFVIYFVYVVFNFGYFSKVFDRKILVVSLVILLFVGFLFALQLGIFSFTGYLSQYFGFLRSGLFAVFYFAVLGALFSLKKFREPFLLVLAFVIPFFAVSFIYLLHFRYVFFVIPVLFIFCAYFIDYVSSYAKRFAVPVALFLVFVVLFSGFTFIPRYDYQLEPLTPQPDFKTAHLYIKENLKPDDVLISSQPTVTSFYVRKPDFAFDYSLSGKLSDSVRVNGTDFERYEGIRIINYSEFVDVVGKNHGFVVIDSLASKTMDQDMLNYTENNLKLIDEASKTNDDGSFVVTYAF